MKKVDNFIAKSLYYILGLLMFIMVAVITAQVISRYIFGSPFTWTEELGRYTFIWMSFLGMALGVKKAGHIALDLLLRGTTGKTEKTLQFLISVLVGVFGILLTISGYKMMMIGTGQNSPSLSIPMELIYVVMPISGILIVYFIVGNIITDFKEGKEAAI